MPALLELSGRHLLMVTDDDPAVQDTQTVLDLIGEGLSHDAGMIVVPVDRLDPSFFHLRSGFAGDMLQKLANYRFKLAVLGDISPYTEASDAFRDFVRESDRGSAVLFCADLPALSGRLAGMTEARVR
jgi:hypothetical protein